MLGKCIIFRHIQNSRVSSNLGLLIACIIAVLVLGNSVTEALDLANLNDVSPQQNSTSNGKKLLFSFNNTIPASSLIPIPFNITEENMLDNLRISANCATVKCNFMIVTRSGYFEFIKDPSLRTLRQKAMNIQVLNETDSQDTHIVYITTSDSYVFVSVNLNQENSSLLTINVETKYSYGRGFIWFLQNYWYIIIIGAACIVFVGISVAVITNGVKGRDLLNGMTSYSKKDKSQRCLLTDEDMKDEIGFKTVASQNVAQLEEMRTYSSDSDLSSGI
ncbi:predicted protein [Naegleria gruberi]|uniref:Predicted protein n=1 Tax=Naegleria gruberi TaxID=5762 RepID=D2VFF8_NAEGR|nr:uncharacterized protein NAEGRDRAFT_67611 [Naegleria gruberi]EFC44455.1 predicted protein [Naegleria gruberi]|eukprot:XP_002677199.1 predicted protein [Naegleria gruberi strain NEG-M]